MTGTFINIATVLIGGSLGLFFGARFHDNIRKTIIAAMGLFTAVMGIKMFLETNNPLFVLAALLVGALLGEWWKIEEGLQSLGRWLEKRFTSMPVSVLGHAISAPDGDSNASMTPNPPGNFIRGFLTTSLLFCVGPMTILGAIQDGLKGDYSLLAIKSVLDGIAAMAFASILGAGVLFSVFVILFYQGGISLLAGQLNTVISPAMMAEMTATGGVILLGIAISSLLEIKPIRVGNLLPALLIAPIIVWIISLF